MKKRAHGDGYVKRLPNGTWFGQIMDGYSAILVRALLPDGTLRRKPHEKKNKV